MEHLTFAHENISTSTPTPAICTTADNIKKHKIKIHNASASPLQ